MSFKIINKNLQLLIRRRNLCLKGSKRFILSPAYQCTEEWNKRFEEPIIKNIEIETFFYQLNEKLLKKTSIAPADVDLFLNKADSKNLIEVINVVQRFRKNWRSRGMLESSHHAFIRIMLESGQLDKLVEILSKRVDYGIFPDKFCYNLILDKLIDMKQYENACKVAVLRMLQEDFESLIGNYLSLKAIYTYFLKSEEPIKEELFIEPKQVIEDEDKSKENEEEGEENEEDEIEYIRVPYLRNPFFDDHFDIKVTLSLIGKTFYLTGNAIKEQNKTLSDSCILFGLVLYQKWNKAIEFLNLNQIKLSKDLVELVDKFITKDLNKPNDDVTKLLDKLKSHKEFTDKTLEQMIEEGVSTIAKLEQPEINELKEIYKNFSKKREKKFKEDLDELLRLEVIEQIKEKKKEFKDKEKKLYFFENYEKFQLLEHEAKIRIKEAEESVRVEEEYIPRKMR